jgi:hypothetical protein
MKKVTIEIKGQEYELPNFLSIENYVKVYSVKDFLGDKFFQAKLINQVLGIKMELILNSNHTQVNYISDHITSLFPNTDYPFYDRFELNGVQYGFIPSWKNMSFAEFVDLDTLLNKEPKDIINNFHIICAIMYRPIISQKSEHDFLIEEYDSNVMEIRAELFINHSLNHIPLFSTLKKLSTMKKMGLVWKMRKILWKTLLNKRSDGLRLSIDYVMMTLRNIQVSSKPPLWKRLTNFFTSWKKKKK